MWHLLSTLVFCAATTVVAIQRNITVDDTDPAISYSGSAWTIGNDTDAWNGTSHLTCENQTSDTRATFSFSGVAIYYVPPCDCDCSAVNGTTLILDGGDPIPVSFVGRHLIGNTGVWGMTNLSNGPHTIVNTGGSSPGNFPRMDAFIYTVDEPDDVPPAPPGAQNVFISADKFAYSEGWVNSTDPVPSCVKSGHVRQSSTLNSTFSFNFTGDSLFLNTLTSSTNSKLSLSINGGEPEIFDTTAPTASCALLNLNVTSLVKRSLERRNGSAVDVQNQCVGKTVSGTTAIDGVTYQKASSSTQSGARIFVAATVAALSLIFLI